MLNERQQAVVDSESKFKAIIAGAGSGKTHTLTHLIKKDIERGVNPSQIVAITFTRNASLELKERLERMEVPIKQMFAGTIHQFCLNIIELFSKKLQLQDNFDIYMQDDSVDIIKWLINKYEYSVKVTRDGLKGADVDRLMAQYNDFMVQSNAIDINQVLTHAAQLVETDQEVKAYVEENFKYFYVDEFQDTNDIQLEVIKLLNPSMITVIGDPDQAIYEWNNAKPEILNKIETHFPGIETHLLVDNYRSTHDIIRASNDMIACNINRIPKQLVAHKDGVMVHYSKHNDISAEINHIAEIILSSDTKLKDTAVIARKNAHAIAVIEGLSQKGIEVNAMLSQASVTKQPDIIKIINLLNVISNPDNRYAVVKALNDLLGTKNAYGILNTDAPIKSLIIDSDAVNVYQTLLDMNDVQRVQTVNEVFKDILKTFSIVKHYKDNEGEVIFNTRLKNLFKFEQIITKWTRTTEYMGATPTLRSFCRYLKLMDLQENAKQEKDAVNVMTVHGSKGLEYETVYLICCNEGDMPMSTSDNIEEERRIAYVAATRARERLYVSSHVTASTKWNKNILRLPSRFISEMGLSDD